MIPTLSSFLFPYPKVPWVSPAIPDRIEKRLEAIQTNSHHYCLIAISNRVIPNIAHRENDRQVCMTTSNLTRTQECKHCKTITTILFAVTFSMASRRAPSGRFIWKIRYNSVLLRLSRDRNCMRQCFMDILLMAEQMFVMICFFTKKTYHIFGLVLIVNLIFL